jgi:hypothetical protein
MTNEEYANNQKSSNCFWFLVTNSFLSYGIKSISSSARISLSLGSSIANSPSFKVSYSSLGIYGAGISFFLSASKSIPMKKGWSKISLSFLFPSRVAGFLSSSLVIKSFSSSLMSILCFTGSGKIIGLFLISCPN